LPFLPSFLTSSPHYNTIFEHTLGSVAPTPIRAYEAEERLKGNTINDILLDEVGRLAQEASSPITDQRGTAEYRRIMVYRLTKRVVRGAYEQAVAQIQS